MSNITTYLEGAIQDWTFNGDAFPTEPSNLYLALHNGDPGNDGTSNELGAGDYDRVSTASGDWVTSGSGPTVAENSTEISFGEATSDWGTVSHVSIWDSSSGGNPLWQGSLDSDKSVQTGDELIFRSNDIHIELD